MEQTWNLKDLLPENKGQDFDAIISGLRCKVEEFEKKRSVLNEQISVEAFNQLLNDLEAIDSILSKISAYGELWFAEDTSCEDAKAYLARAEQLSTEIANKTLFFSIWWKKASDSTAQRLIAGSGKNKYFLEHMRKLRAHSLDENEEKIINIKDETGAGALSKLYDIFTSSFKFPLKIDGKTKKLTVSELKVYFQGSDAKLRESAYKSLFKVYKKNRDVLGEIYCNIVRDWSNEGLKLRKYASPINVRNKANDFSDDVIDVMLETVRDNRALFQEYFELKAKALGIQKMSRFHLYAPLEKVDEKVSFEEAKKTVLENYEKFSPEFAELAKKVFDCRHVHAVLGKNKRSGAFCYSVTPKDVPYVLLNYAETSDDVITMAHEMGHAVHDLLAKDNTIFAFQPPLPLAETASVFGELIVTHSLLNKEKNHKIKKHLIAGKLDDIYATILRQTYFILFEKVAHNKIPEGATLKDLEKEYHQQLKEQFGKIKVPKDFAYEWLYIPHIFHSPFYCYAYTFGNLLTLALYQMYKEQGESFVPKYLKLLSYGGSESPEKVLQELGIDIRNKEFWQKGFDVIKEMLDEFKRL